MTSLRFLFLTATLLVACDGGGDDELTRHDVEDLPLGDGVGTAATGEYEIELYTRACRGRCPVIQAGIFTVTLCDVGDVDDADASIVQTDGAFVMDANGLVLDRLRGGIDADGSFTVGARGTQYGGQVEIIVLSTGTLTGDTFTGTAESRAVGQVEGQSIDCTTINDVTGVRLKEPAE